MKKIYLTVLCAVVLSNVNAQITLTQSTSTPIAGESFSYITQSTSMNVSSSGANQTWDFSGITGSSTAMNAINPSAAQDPSTFPLANVVESYSGSELYMLSSATEYTQVGNYIPGQLRMTYTDPRENLKFPLTYQTIYNETFQGNLVNLTANQTFARGGTVEILADGYGELILPYTTVNNVLRLKVTSIYEDEYLGTPIYSYIEVYYLWYNLTNHSYIAGYNELSANGSLVATNAIILDQTSYVTSINDIASNEQFKLSYYPNPAINSITLDNVQDIKSISIVDLKGQSVKTITGIENNQIVDLSDLNSGMYFINYISNDASFMDKLIIK